MNPWWLYAIPAALAAITIAGILATVLAGRQTEERPGTIDLTGIKPVSRWYGPSAVEGASRARAEARRSAFESRGDDAA